jgi:hypothetical protein
MAMYLSTNWFWWFETAVLALSIFTLDKSAHTCLPNLTLWGLELWSTSLMVNSVLISYASVVLINCLIGYVADTEVNISCKEYRVCVCVSTLILILIYMINTDQLMCEEDILLTFATSIVPARFAEYFSFYTKPN